MSSIKITDLFNSKEFTFSFEVTPNVSLEAIDNLTVEPVFYSITWHAKTHLCKDFDIGPLKLASELKNRGKEVLLHLSCDHLKKQYTNKLLQILQEKGVRNLFLMLGENFDASQSDFRNTKELIEYIRQLTGKYFCLGISGFPNSNRRMATLKEKVDSGADFIITQAFFDISEFKNFVKECEDAGIKVPIVPGIFVYETQKELMAFADVCKVKVSDNLMEQLKRKEFVSGTDIVKKMVFGIVDSRLGCKHIHLFTLNKLSRLSEFIMDFRKYEQKL